jgi:hypothetical protein
MSAGFATSIKFTAANAADLCANAPSAAAHSPDGAVGEAPILEDGARRITQSGVILTQRTSTHLTAAPHREERLVVLRWLLSW